MNDLFRVIFSCVECSGCELDPQLVDCILTSHNHTVGDWRQVLVIEEALGFSVKRV